MYKKNLIGLNLDEINKIILKYKQPKYRAKQIFQWIYKGIYSIDEMLNLPNEIREQLKDKYEIYRLRVVKKYQDPEDDTIKLLFALKDKNIIECVVMQYKYGNTICISTQVGCNMGCIFCASTTEGKVRNLDAGEMMDQVIKAQEIIDDKISNIVLMGSGEPLDNLNEVLKFINLVNNQQTLNIGQRHITLSTCGIVPKIYELADKQLQINLSISLHTANDIKRKEMMPIAKKYSIRDLIDACTYYINNTNRRVTFEYALIKDKNDTLDDAIQTGKLLKGMLCHVNLIPINSIKEKDYEKSLDSNIKIFKEKLESFGIPTTIRKEMGSSINAACGQLRKGYLNLSEDENNL